MGDQNDSERVVIEQPPTLEEIEDSIPESRKSLSFGGPDETVIDVMEKAEKDQHHRGGHMDEPLETCPFCPDPDNERVSVSVVGDNDD